MPLLLVPLAASACFVRAAGAGPGVAARGVALLGGEALLLLDNQAEFNDFKAIYAPLHTPDARDRRRACGRRAATTCCSTISPSGSTPTSPTTPACWASPGPPQTFGLYRDGNRIAALPKPGRARRRLCAPPRWTRCPTA